MKQINATLDEEDIAKLEAMVKSAQAANLSHALRQCVKAYPFKVEVKTR